MTRKLNEREKRVLLLGAVAAVAILAFTLGADWFETWGKARASLAAAQRKLNEVEADRVRQAGLMAIVPVFEAPEPEETQKFLFRDKLHEQFKKAGINTEPLQIIAARRVRNLPHRVLKIRCKGKCKFDQLLNLLVSLRENPYLVGVEELRIQCDSKEPPEKRSQVEIDLTVSTFVK